MSEKFETNLIVFSTVGILLFGIFSSVLIKNYLPGQESAFRGSWACTADIRVCPDGTTVSRTPPYCHFAACQ